MIRTIFEDGFHCQRCGACCLAAGWVYVTEAEAYRIARYLNVNPFDFFRQRTSRDEGWLVLASPTFQPFCFLESGECTIYPVRPQNCRTYPLEFPNHEEYSAALSICPEMKRLKDQPTEKEGAQEQ